jgi:hypothetical protein
MATHIAQPGSRRPAAGPRDVRSVSVYPDLRTYARYAAAGARSAWGGGVQGLGGRADLPKRVGMRGGKGIGRVRGAARSGVRAAGGEDGGLEWTARRRAELALCGRVGYDILVDKHVQRGCILVVVLYRWRRAPNPVCRCMSMRASPVYASPWVYMLSAIEGPFAAVFVERRVFAPRRIPVWRIAPNLAPNPFLGTNPRREEFRSQTANR